MKFMLHKYKNLGAFVGLLVISCIFPPFKKHILFVRILYFTKVKDNKIEIKIF